MSKYTISELEQVKNLDENDLLLVSKIDDNGNPVASNSITVANLRSSLENIQSDDKDVTGVNDCDLNTFNSSTYSIVKGINIDTSTGQGGSDSNISSSVKMIFYRHTSSTTVMTTTSAFKTYATVNVDFSGDSGSKYIDISKPYILTSNVSVEFDIVKIDDSSKDHYIKFKYTAGTTINGYVREGAQNFATTVDGIQIPALNIQDTNVAIEKEGSYYYTCAITVNNDTTIETKTNLTRYTTTSCKSNDIRINDDCIGYLNAGVCLTPGTTTGKPSYIELQYYDPTGNWSAIFRQYADPAGTAKTFNTVRYSFKAKAGTKFRIGIQLEDSSARYYYEASQYFLTFVKSTPWDSDQSLYLTIPSKSTESNIEKIPTCKYKDGDADKDYKYAIATISDAIFSTTGSYVNNSDRTNNLYVKVDGYIVATFEMSSSPRKILPYSFYVKPNQAIQLTTSRKVSAITANRAKITLQYQKDAVVPSESFKTDMDLTYDTSIDATFKRYAFGWYYLRYNPSEDSSADKYTEMKESNGVITRITDSAEGWFVRPPETTNYAIQLRNVTEFKVSNSVGDHFRLAKRLTSVKLHDSSKLKKLDDYAFYNCTNLKSFETASGNEDGLSSIATIGYAAFCKCENLNSSMTFNNVTTISEKDTFRNCKCIPSLSFNEFSGSIPENFLRYDNASNLTSVTVNFPKATVIGKYAFGSSISKSAPKITHVNSTTDYDAKGNFAAVQHVCEAAFMNNVALSDVAFRYATTIDKDAFKLCSELKTVSLSAIEELGVNCFANDKVIERFSVGDKLKTIHNNAFSNAVDCIFDFSKLETVPELTNVNAFPSASQTKYKWKILLKNQDMYNAFCAAPIWQKFCTKSYDRYEYGDKKATVGTGNNKVEL